MSWVPDYRYRGRRCSARMNDTQRDELDQLLARFGHPSVGQPLDHASPLNLDQWFGQSYKDYWLEVGFGAGEHLLHHAATAPPSVGIVGCEVFVNGVLRTMRQLHANNHDNVRIWFHEVQPLLQRLPEHSLARVSILFPDPWPKKRHHKRRLIHPELLPQLHRLLRPQGEVVVATDDADYLAHIQQYFAASALFKSQDQPIHRPATWPLSTFEAKGLKAGRTATYLWFKR